MELILNLGCLETKGKNKRNYGLFLCPYCLSWVIKQLSAGKICKSCGCVAGKLISEANKGKKHTEEQKRNNSKSQKGKKLTKEHKQKISKFQKGRVTSEETRQKMSEAQRGKKKSEEQKQRISKSTKERFKNPENPPFFGIHRFGEESPNWQGGKSFEIYPQEFNKKLKQQILERDNYKCQSPGCTEIHDRLHVHHIDYDKKNSNPENLITLGTSCHIKTNGKNRQYWTDFYQKIIGKRNVD